MESVGGRVTAYRLGAERRQEVLGPPMPTAGSLAPTARTPGAGQMRGELVRDPLHVGVRIELRARKARTGLLCQLLPTSL